MKNIRFGNILKKALAVHQKLFAKFVKSHIHWEATNLKTNIARSKTTFIKILYLSVFFF